MSLEFDPVFSLAIMFLQISHRFMKINLTKAQEKILMHPIAQIAMYASIIFFSTKSILLTGIIVILSYLFLYVLFNENHRLNILPKSWLHKENLLNETFKPNKHIYKENLQKYHQ